MKSPYEQAQELYKNRGFDSENFEEDVKLYAKHGYVLATPLEFAMVRPVYAQWSKEVICCVEREYQLSQNELTLNPNCWHIHVVVGELLALLSWLPYSLPFMSMERRGKFKIYSTERIYENAKATTTT